MAGTDEARPCDHVRHDHEHRRVSAVYAAKRAKRRISLQPADRDDLRAHLLTNRFDDVHSPGGLLRAAAFEKAGSAHGGSAAAGLQRPVLSRGSIRPEASVESIG